MKSACLKLISKFDDRDIDLVFSAIDDYQTIGLPPEKAQVAAVRDALRVLQAERDSHELTALNVRLSPDRNLILAHNLTAENLRAAMDLGGLPAPSLAITKVDAPIQGFGEITLIGDASLATPSAKNPVYDADVYSPRFPDVKVKVDDKLVRAAIKPLADAAQAAGMRPRTADSAIDEMSRNRLSNAIGDLSYDPALRLGYANAILGKNLTVPTKQVEEAPRAKAGSSIVEQSPLRELLPTLDLSVVKPSTSGDLGKKVYAALINKTLADLGDEAKTPEGFTKAMGLVNRRINIFANTTIESGSTEFEIDKVGLMSGRGLDAIINLYRNMQQERSDAPAAPTVRTETDFQALDDSLNQEAPREQFSEWLREKLRPAMGERRIVKESGRTTEFTLDNIVREMTRKVRDAEGFNYGLGNARSKGATKFKSLKQIQGVRDRIVSKEEFEAARKEIDAEFGSLVNAVAPFQKYKGDSATELLAEAIGNSYSTPMSKALEDAALVGVPESLQARISEFAGALVDAPTEYFEAKPQRAVGLDEFKGAVVPSDTPSDVIDMIESLGLQIEQYSRGDQASRSSAVKRLANELNNGGSDVLFSRGRPGGSLGIPQIEAMAERVMKDWANPPSVIVATDMSDPVIPEAAAKEDAQQLSNGAEGTPSAFYHKGTVYIIASQMRSNADVADAMFHEALGHYGMRRLFGLKFADILNDISDVRRQEVIDMARKYGLTSADVETASDQEIWAQMSPEERQKASEEVLAFMAQETPELSFVKRAIAVIRTWLRNHIPMLANMYVTDDQIINGVIIPARKFVKQGLEAAKYARDTDIHFQRSSAKDLSTPYTSDTITIDGVERSALNSEGRRIAETEEQLRNFWRWFGDSKAVDFNGSPLVVYHGTTSDFSEFALGNNDWDAGVFFTSSPTVAADVYGRGKEVPNTTGIRKALDGISEQEARALVQRLGWRDFQFDIDEPDFQVPFGDQIADYAANTFDEYEGGTQALEALADALGVPAKLPANGSNVMPVYLSLQNPLVVDGSRLEFDQEQQAEWMEHAKEQGHDGLIIRRYSDGGFGLGSSYRSAGRHDVYIAFRPEQIKSATGNNGQFDPSNPDIRKSTGRTSTGAPWDSPSAEKFDDLVYKLQDKQIDTKRVVEAIKGASGAIADDLNVYLREELFHGRAAKRTEDFANMELTPLIEQLQRDGLKLEELEEYLHARHAPEANRIIAQRNPGQPGLQDGGSGMMTQDALNYMASLPADLRQKLDAAAQRVDDIIKNTRQMYVDYELESQGTINAWGNMFQHYIPLQREDKDGAPGLGQGFSIKGKEAKGRTGSTRKVVDILANIALQRERAIVRGEKNRVSQALHGLAAANPNPGFWEVDVVPTERVFNPNTGLVEDRADPLYKSRENAVIAKIKDANGKVREHAVLFNEEDERAMRMAAALKNLDAAQLEGLLGVSAKISRYFAAVNTQYNPVFGVVNLVRDVQGALLNLSSTPLADDRAKIAKYTLSAMRGIYADMRAARKGQNPGSQWATLWDDFASTGGQTGYREMFATSADRSKAIQKALDPDAWMNSRLGKIFTVNGALKVPMAQARRAAAWIFDWLSDYNDTFENSVRLAAYKAGLERGLSKDQAASIAKNLTVNFNRKGQVALQAGALYAFFNASIQGTARLGQTLFDMDAGKPKTLRLSAFGKKVVYGGMLLGSMQAMLLAAAGFNDDDPPEFVRERSLILPIGGGKYITVPMPLGFHVIPAIGRMTTEFALSGFKDPHKRAVALALMFADTFNPIGNAGLSMQTLAPTALDPLVALTENKDYTGKPIARESSNKAIPGHALGRDTATSVAKFLSEAVNTLSGGNEYRAGVFSPTPDQIDYLIGQATGGVGRELSKVEQSTLAVARGEALPTYKVPLVGRFVGDAKSQASEGTAFYANTERLNELETEIKGLQKDGKFAEAAELRRSRSDSYLITMANQAERQIQRLRQQKRELIKAGADREQVKAIEDQVTAAMARLNRAAESLREKQEN